MGHCNVPLKKKFLILIISNDNVKARDPLGASGLKVSLSRLVIKHEEVMSVHLIQLEPGVGCELLQVLPGLVLDAAPAALVGVLLLRQRHSQDVGEDHFDVSSEILDLTSIKIGKVPPAQLRICPFMCYVLPTLDMKSYWRSQ